MRKWLVVILCLAMFGACGGEQDKDPKNGSSAKKKGDPDPVSSKGKKWKGWRWKGKSDNCFFLSKGRCFGTFKSACKTAKCKDKPCIKDDSAPAFVYCEGDKKPKHKSAPSNKGKGSKNKRAKERKKKADDDAEEGAAPEEEEEEDDD